MTLLPAGAVTDLRAISLSAMVDECTVTRKSEAGRIFNPTTGDYNDPAPNTIYTGACRVRPLAAGRGNVDTAGDPVTLRTYAATLPHTVNDIAEGDILTVTISDDAQLEGRALYVLSVGFLSDNIHRRLMLEDRQQPTVAGS